MNEKKLNIDSKGKELLREVKSSIMSIEPEAEVYLFGSRVRGEFNENSYCDFLVLLPGDVTDQRKSITI